MSALADRGGMTGLDLSRRRVAKNTLSQVAAYAVSWGTKGVAMVAVARFLGPAGLGVFSVSWTVASILSFFAVLGIERWLVRELSRATDPRDLWTSMPLATLLGTLFGAGTALVPGIVGVDPELARTLVAAGAFVALSAPVLVLRSAFLADERMELDTLVQGIEGGLALVALFGALLAGGGVVGAMAALAAGRLANLIASAVLYRRRWGRLALVLRAGEWPRVLRQSFPMGAAYLFSTLTLRVDIVLLGILLDPRRVGLYSAAALVVSTLPVVVHSLNTSLYPVLSRAAGPDDPELHRIFGSTWRVLVITSLVAAAGASVLAGGIVGLLFGDGFAAAGPLLAVLVWGLPGRVVHSFCGTVYNAIDRQGSWARTVGIGAFVNVVGNLALIPVWGVWGAVVSTLVTEALLAVLALAGLRPLRASWRPVAEGIVVAAVVAGVAFVTPGHVLARVATGGLIFAVLALADRRRGRDRRTPGPKGPAGLDLSLPGGAGLRIQGLGAEGTRLRRWVRGTLEPLADGRDRSATPDLGIRFGDVPPAAGPRFAHLPVTPHPDGLRGEDHLGRGALLPLAGCGDRAIVADPTIDPWFFQRWIYLPLLRAALWRSGGVLLRGAGASVGGRRIAIIGWERTGKTRVLLELLRRGADFLGDDWLALAPDGTVAPVAAQLALRDAHKPHVPEGRWPGSRVSLRDLGVRAARRAARRTASMPMASMALSRVAEWGWKAGTKKLGLHSVFPETAIAEPGPLDAVVVLVRPGTTPPPRGAVAEVLGAQMEVDLGHCHDLQAAFRYAFPGRLTEPLFPSAAAEREILARAIDRVPVAFVPCPEDAAGAARAADRIAHEPVPVPSSEVLSA